MYNKRKQVVCRLILESLLFYYYGNYTSQPVQRSDNKDNQIRRLQQDNNRKIDRDNIATV